MNPLVSVILPTRDDPDSLAESVASVLGQSFPNLECLVVDDGSSRDVRIPLEKFARDPRLRILRRDHGGAGAARNTGARAARGRWLAFQDAQDLWLPDKLERALAALDACGDPRVRLFYSGCRRVHLNGEVQVTGQSSARQRAWMDVKYLRPGTAGVQIQSVVCRRDLFEEAGPFDEILPRFIDMEWLMRARRFGRFLPHPEPLVIWRQSRGGISDNHHAMAPALHRIRDLHGASITREDPTGHQSAILAANLAYAEAIRAKPDAVLRECLAAARHAPAHPELACYLRRVLALCESTAGLPAGRWHHWRWNRLRASLATIPAPRKTMVGFWPHDPQFEAHGNYPPGCKVEQANDTTIAFARSLDRALDIAEIGVYHGHTSRAFARLVAEKGGSLHLFDFEDRVLHVRDLLRCDGHDFAILHPNSRKTHDSYNWSLKRLLADSPGPCFDYVFLDGAHTWAHDALAFLLADRLLRPGGFIDFDDHDWSLAISPTLNPGVFPRTAADFTTEQIAERQVDSILNLLVRRDPRYSEVVENKIFRKTRA